MLIWCLKITCFWLFVCNVLMKCFIFRSRQPRRDRHPWPNVRCRFPRTECVEPGTGTGEKMLIVAVCIHIHIHIIIYNSYIYIYIQMSINMSCLIVSWSMVLCPSLQVLGHFSWYIKIVIDQCGGTVEKEGSSAGVEPSWARFGWSWVKPAELISPRPSAVWISCFAGTFNLCIKSRCSCLLNI